jgi:ATP-dependent helicase HepA
MFDHLGLDVSDLSLRSYHLRRGQRESEAFADLPEEGLSVTFDRSTALAREDLAFMTVDHPVFLGALEQLLDSERGNAAFAVWKSGQGKAIWLECAVVIEVLAPQCLHLDRFLPPTVLRVVVDHHGKRVKPVPASAVLEAGDARRLVTQEVFRREWFPQMLEAALACAEEEGKTPVGNAREQASAALEGELARLREMAARNSAVSMAEIRRLEQLRDEILVALASPRIRLDAVRLIWRT